MSTVATLLYYLNELPGFVSASGTAAEPNRESRSGLASIILKGYSKKGDYALSAKVKVANLEEVKSD